MRGNLRYNYFYAEVENVHFSHESGNQYRDDSSIPNDSQCIKLRSPAASPSIADLRLRDKRDDGEQIQFINEQLVIDEELATSQVNSHYADAESMQVGADDEYSTGILNLFRLDERQRGRSSQYC